MCDSPSNINLSSSAQSSLWFVFALSLCTCLIALILTHQFHAHRIFFSSNRLFMTTSVIGAIMVGISAAIIIPSTLLTPSACTAHVWMLFLGLHLFFSSLCVKLYRLHAIFTHTKITAVRIPDKRMLIWCGISCITLFLVLIVWAIIAPWQVVIPCDNDTEFMYHCQNTQQHIFLPLLLSLIGLLLCTLGYYIYHTYHIPYQYNDTTRIGIVLTNALITLMIAISVYASFRDANRPASQLKLIRVVSMLYGVTSSIMILYVPICYQLIIVYESKKQDVSLSDISRHVGSRHRISYPVTSHSHLPWSMIPQPPMQMDAAIQRQRDREMEAVDQRIAGGNATMEEKITHLMNHFDARSTRMLALQHEESELIMLATRKRTENDGITSILFTFTYGN